VDCLPTLVEKDLLKPESTSFAGEEAFRFRHQLLRDAAYASLPKEGRAHSHERFATWLEEKLGERASEYEEMLGYHLEQAHRCRVGWGWWARAVRGSPRTPRNASAARPPRAHEEICRWRRT
jgi:hypothetical protein